MNLTTSPSVRPRAVTWSKGHGDAILRGAAPYRNGGGISLSCCFFDFGGNNHKYSPPVLVTIEYRSTHTYTPADFPAVEPIVTAAAPARSATTWRGASVDSIERARRYLARVPPAIAGEHGDVHTFRVCCRLVRGFALDDDTALAVITDWNSRCQPPWNEHELRDKLRRARRYGREPIAGLLSPAR